MTTPLAKPKAWDDVAEAYAAELSESFEHFARTALALAALDAPAHVVDVACGAGALTRIAVEAGHRVSALDQSEGMLTQLRRRVPAPAATRGADSPHAAGVDVTLGDGMALPYADATFDAGFSMFGLMFFPDRAKGFRELRRVLKPGAPAIVASWAPLSEVPVLATVLGALAERFPPPPGAPAFQPPLADPAECVAEMSAAGFRDVVCHADVQRVETTPNVEAMWTSMQRTNAIVVLRKNAVDPETWTDAARFVLARLRERHGTGEQTITMTARLTVGRA
ncbi:MAG: class I SAM-dependent methyltransferase [Labilithrix sp.]|nr:class I SAM-dependent methyltransferase [Labilithrix sp.]MCW5816669.1 class I SAM-dependent methyltransferase [Labilithrix sp.]